jgi:hypothetical protein
MKRLLSMLIMFMLCLSLLVPTLAGAQEVKTSVPAPDLRVALGQLLGEHAQLAIIAMQKGYDAAPDFGDAAAALGKNTDDLTAAIASVYGQPAGDAFKPIWASHIGYFVDYVKATGAKDEAGRQKAVTQLEDYRMKQAEFFNMANPQYFDKTAIADGLKMHITHLLDAFNSYVNKDYDKTYSNVRTAYAHMFMTSDALAGGITAQFPDKFPAAAPMPQMSSIWMKIGSGALTINGMTTWMDVAPFMKDTHTFIPLRYLGEAIGAEVTWDAATQTAWVKTGGNTATFWIGKSYMELNGQSKEIGTPIFLEGGRTQVPLRFITELLGWNVQWNDADGSITLTKGMTMDMAHSH